MVGNVWQWMADSGKTYSSQPMTDPFGYDSIYRSVRGGSYAESVASCTSANRYHEGGWQDRASEFGFRLVRVRRQ